MMWFTADLHLGDTNILHDMDRPFVLASLYENSLARGRFLLTPRVTWSGFGVAALAFVFYFSKL